MIPKECPFSDRQKLKLILHGTDNVCLGICEKDDNGVYKKCEFCHRCNFHDKSSTLFSLKPNPFQHQHTFNPLSVPGYVVPNTVGINTAPNTGGINTAPNTYMPIYNSGTYGTYNNGTYNKPSSDNINLKNLYSIITGTMTGV